MKHKHIILYVLLGLLMMQYQNCASPSQEFMQDANVDVNDSATGIDEVNVGRVFFPQEKVTATQDSPVVVIGACDQSGAMIGWTLKSQDGELIERGLSECDQGAFEIELSDQWLNYCQESLILKAALGAKASSETLVDPQCNI
ncbi:MAG: hypothetical protein KDD33_04455 [Bdellovibrionales bacterium]|nr:hypothetical protein [Bdellovibrionales bacterium]